MVSDCVGIEVFGTCKVKIFVINKVIDRIGFFSGKGNITSKNQFKKKRS